jgi:hypothetical protein
MNSQTSLRVIGTGPESNRGLGNVYTAHALAHAFVAAYFSRRLPDDLCQKKQKQQHQLSAFSLLLRAQWQPLRNWVMFLRVK